MPAIYSSSPGAAPPTHPEHILGVKDGKEAPTVVTDQVGFRDEGGEGGK